jgi:hypothetical protein
LPIGLGFDKVVKHAAKALPHRGLEP